MKQFTSLKQSKKLAEILPHESADMRIGNYVGESGYVDGTNIHYYPKGESFGAPEIIDAWSLAALLNVIPYNVTFNRGVYRFKLVKFPDYWECYHENFGTVSTGIFRADNPVDACYEMILRLNELNLL